MSYSGGRGIFTLSQGVPSELPKLPNTIDNALEAQRFNLMKVHDDGEVGLTLAKYKRYRMKDIKSLSL